MSVMDWHVEMAQISILFVNVGRVAECALIVRHWPGWCAHYSQIVVSVSV